MATADYVKSWINQCQAEHALCSKEHFLTMHGSISPTRPRRLLDTLAFKDTGRLRLVDADTTISARYCALSYSWGFGKRFLMTSKNLKNFHREIFVKDLPNTIRDAVRVVRGIGIRYLWIDALCIMQDGHTSPAASDDWIDQVSKLHDIFGNAEVTIAASESFDGDQGFIKSRNPLSQLVCHLYAETKLAYDVVPPCTPHCLAHPFDNAQYHLDSRAWVFQERILSSRTLHFTRNFLHLECRTELECEGRHQIYECYHAGTVPKADYQSLFAALPLTGIENVIPEFFLSVWHSMIRRYSTTNLCRMEDLLLAIAGLAVRIQRQTSLTWSFGLWREYLIREILWYVRGGTGVQTRERAPSWSWASVEVQDAQIVYEPMTPTSIFASVTRLPDISKFEPQQPLNGNEVEYAIRIAGPILRRTPLSEEDANLGSVHYSCRGIRTAHPSCPFHPDYDLAQDIVTYDLLVARIAEVDMRKSGSPAVELDIGLVISPVSESPRCFRRVGYFHYTYSDEPESGPNLTPRRFGGNLDMHEVEII